MPLGKLGYKNKGYLFQSPFFLHISRLFPIRNPLIIEDLTSTTNLPHLRML